MATVKIQNLQSKGAQDHHTFDLTFYYNGEPLEIVKEFKYLGLVFTTGGSFAAAQSALSGQAQKAIFK